MREQIPAQLVLAIRYPRSCQEKVQVHRRERSSKRCVCWGGKLRDECMSQLHSRIYNTPKRD